jgi:hypothetical protein
MVDDTNGLHDSIVREFLSELNNLEQHLRPLFAAVVSFRRRGGKVNFANLGDSLSCIFDMDGLSARPKPNCHKDFYTKCGLDSTPPIPAGEIHAVDVELASLDPKIWVRGKFHMWFLVEFIDRSWENLSGSAVTERKKVRKTISINPKNAFALFSNAASKPAGLTEFLAGNIAA